MLRLPHLAIMIATAGLLLLPMLAAAQPNQTGSNRETQTTQSAPRQGPLASDAGARDAAQGRTQGTTQGSGTDPSQRGGDAPAGRVAPTQGAAPAPAR